MPAKVFIDGESGTTGLQIRERLARRRDLELLTLAPDRRRQLEPRSDLINSADAVILCLPDDAAREAVGLVESTAVRVIDASTAHRTAPGWVYGLPEMAKTQREAIEGGRRVANPGCYASGFIALVRPLVDAGLLPAAWPITVSAVSGYSGGGKAMIAEFEDPAAPGYTTSTYRAYALHLAHKHIPEMQAHARLAHRPLFAPAVGRYFQGMIVEVPLPLHALVTTPGLTDVQGALGAAYEHEPFVEVAPADDVASLATLDPQALNGSDRMRLYAFGSEDGAQARLIAILDNLGTGAAGAAIQNLNLVLGLPEAAGLITND